MMNKKTLFIFILGIAIMACQNNKQNNDTSISEKKPSDKPMNVVGGWSKVEINDDVKNAADFALTEIEASSEMKEILKAKTQIVSGKNYDITFYLQNGEKWNVIVYKNLKNEYSLTKSLRQ